MATADPVTLVLPIHNSADALPKAADAWLAALDRLGRPYELLIVDDGSTDGTAEAADRLVAHRKHVRLLRHATRRGTGACIRTALAECSTPLFATTGLEYPYHPTDLGRLIAAVGRQEEIYGKPFEVSVACGCRSGRPAPAAWKWLGRAYRFLARVLVGYPPAAAPGWLGFREHRRAWLAWMAFGNPLHDPDCALRVYRRSVFDKFPIQSDGGFVHTELVAKLVFTTHLLDEVTLSPSPAAVPSPDWADFGRVFRDPQFTPPDEATRGRQPPGDAPATVTDAVAVHPGADAPGSPVS
ncbi:MAG: glycosyltransferase family 2 protein [Gemmataceae bacterium]